jgi:hypothetical protein
MPRALIASRATVPRGREADYVAILARLAALVRTRGGHFWLFRDPGTPGAFLEFTESPGAEEHRARPASDTEAAALERRLEAIAHYAPDRRVVWEEVSLEEP